MNHYNDTFQLLVQEKRTRTQSFVVALILVTLHCLSIFNKTYFTIATSSIIKAKLADKLPIDITVINSLIWFGIFIASLRYYQANVGVNRLYNYLYGLEKQFTNLNGAPFINREDAFNQSNYKSLASWINIIYVWVAPALLLLISGIKSFDELVQATDINLSLVLNVTLYVALLISTALYFRGSQRGGRFAPPYYDPPNP